MRGIIIGSLGFIIGVMCIASQALGRWEGKGGSGYTVGGVLIVFAIYRVASGIKQA